MIMKTLSMLMHIIFEALGAYIWAFSTTHFCAVHNALAFMVLTSLLNFVLEVVKLAFNG